MIKLILVLAATTLLTISTVQALSIVQEQEIMEQVALLQEQLQKRIENDEINYAFATPSNGTESSILEELELSKRAPKGAGCYAAGPYGGGGGRAFQELQDNCNAVVTGLVIRYGDVIDSIQLKYKTSSGQFITGHQYGGSGGAVDEIQLDVDQGEDIFAVFGASGSLINRLGFVTNLGRVLGPYGGLSGDRFSVSKCTLRGIFGRYGTLIDNIGFYCK